MAELQLSNSPLVALVDDEDLPKVNGYRWRLHSEGYALREEGRRETRRVFWLHRVVAGYSRPDHRNGNKLDCRKSNLRPANGIQNGGNRQRACNKKSSAYKGVSYRPARKRFRAGWIAYITHKEKTGKQVHLGFFDSEIEAALAYNRAALKLFGEFALLNKV